MSEIIVFDWETTSPEPETARGVQFAALSNTRGPLINQICDPEVDIHHEAAEIHGITREMTLGKPKDYEIARKFVEDWEDAGRPITAGHNSVTFDTPITRRLAKAGGSHVDFVGFHIDTMYLCQRLYPEAPSFRLSANEEEVKKEGAIGLTQWLGLGTGEGAHDAFEDVKMVLKLIAHLCEVKEMTVEELARWADEPFIHEVAGFGKHKGKKWGKGPGCVPWHYVKWCCENWKSASKDLQATVFHHYGLRFRFARRLSND